MANARNFETLMLPHLHAAINLARWLVRDAHVAEDLVQDAYLRALRHFDSLRGDEAKPWLLGIVRNQCFGWLEQQRLHPQVAWADGDGAQEDSAAAGMAEGELQAGAHAGPDAMLEQARRTQLVDQAILALAPNFREVIVLRELEELSYSEIAQIVAIPIGTVMSRLARGRAELKIKLAVLYRNNGHE